MDFSSIRIGRLVLALAIGVISFTMAQLVDTGFTKGWSQLARSAWAVTLVVGIIAAALLFLTATGLLTAETVNPRGLEPIALPTMLAVYLGTMGLAVGLAIILESTYRIQGPRTILITLGTTFLVAGSGRPVWLYGTIRRLGWFSAIRNDATMRTTLTLMGAGAVLAGLLIPFN
jgi:hypothetical protein